MSICVDKHTLEPVGIQYSCSALDGENLGSGETAWHYIAFVGHARQVMEPQIQVGTGSPRLILIQRQEMKFSRTTAPTGE